MTHNRLPLLLLLASALSLAAPAQAGPYKGPFTGLFLGQGCGCWGELFIQTETLTWLPASWTTCQRTTYTIVDDTLHTPFENWDHIVFKLNHLSKDCVYRYIELRYFQTQDEARSDAGRPEGHGVYNDWLVIGFSSYKDYKTIAQKGDSNGYIPYDISKKLLCGLPYDGKPFPYGTPVQ